ncbi:alpha-mannosidase [Paenibacillus alkaliterrae]|nr:alpha-mannosidase [Paenibacillus alkaliterrae]
MFWTIEKLEQRLKELNGFRYREIIPFTKMRFQEDTEGAIGTYPSDSGEWSEVRIGDRWNGRDKTIWLAMEIEMPSTWKDLRPVGLFNFGVTGRGNISGFESLLFVNGAPYQGIDTNHTEVLLPQDSAGSRISLHVRLWTGLNGYLPSGDIEHQLQQAEIAWIDEPTDDLYYTGTAVLETVKVLAPNSTIHLDLLQALDRAVKVLDWSRPGSDEFYRSVERASHELNQRLGAMPKMNDITVQCIGHTHIDVAWLWRLKHTREKSARSFSTVLRLMESYPDYIFLQTQPQLYAYLKVDYPEIYAAIRERIQEGQWEAGGAMWLEADCNLASGESLVRQLLYGIQFFREEFGIECKYLWLPDVFGYSWALPQILKKSGIEAFMTTKISWNQYNRMPHDTFMWRGIDGTEMLTHFITTPDPSRTENGAFFYTYNGTVTPETVQGIWDTYRDKALNRKLLLAYGYGDGGGGVNRDMLEMRRRLERMPGLPNVTTGRADDYFDDLVRRVGESEEYVHTWDGELYLELHRGTYTSQAYTKRANRKLELMYREVEWLSAMLCMMSNDWREYRREDLLAGWTILMRNQFHDIIPGSSIREVYEDSRVEYEEAEKIAAAVRAASESELRKPGSEEGSAYTLFNSAPWVRNDVLELPLQGEDTGGGWIDEAGNELCAELASDKWLVQAEGLPSMGFKSVEFVRDLKTQPMTCPFLFEGKRLETPFYRIDWNEAGQLTGIYDKAFVRSVLEPGSCGNVFQVFEDKPKSRHEAWDIDLYYEEKKREISMCTSIIPEEI